MREKSTFPDKVTHFELLLVILGIALISALKIAYLHAVVAIPEVFHDELFYRDGAKSIFELSGYRYRNGNPIQHYPPLYPIFLSPAFFLGHNFYTGMLFVNVILTSMALIPLYLLARTYLGGSKALLVLLLGMLAPYHLFARYIMSENLLFLITAILLYLLFAYQGALNRKLLWISFLLGLALITKYIFAPLVPLFYLALALQNRNLWKKPDRKLVSMILCATLPLLFVLLLWGLYTYHIETPLTYFGKGHPVTQYLEKTINPINFAKWLGYYGSCVILGLFPYISAMYLHRRSLLKAPSGIKGLTIFLAAGTTILCLVATKSSSAAGYNLPDPLYVLVRYISLLFPFFVIPAVAAATNTACIKSRGVSSNVAILAHLLLLFGAAYWFLTNGTPKWFLDTPCNGIYLSPFAGNFPTKRNLFLALCTIGLGFFCLTSSWKKTNLTILAFLCLIATGFHLPLPSNPDLVKLQKAITSHLLRYDGQTTVFLHSFPQDISTQLRKTEKNASFFVDSMDARAVFSFTHANNFTELPTDGIGNYLLITPICSLPHSDSISLKGRDYCFYSQEQPFSVPSLLLAAERSRDFTINSYGPKGFSASKNSVDFWFKTSATNEFVFVVIDSKVIVPQGVTHGDVLTLELPSIVTSAKGTHTLALYYPKQNFITKAVEVVVD